MFCVHCGSNHPDNAAVCPACGKPAVSAAGRALLGAATVIAPETAFFNVGTTKLVLMTIATFGFYEIYWLYKNWVAERALSQDLISPFWRAFFAPLFIYSLAARVRDRSVSMQLATTMPPALIAVAFILLSIAIRAPDPIWLVAYLSGATLVPIQKGLAQINAARGIGLGKEARYSPINIVWLTVSALLWLLVLAGMMFPELE